MEYPGTAGQILRRVFEDTRLNHIDKFLAEFPDLLPFYNEAKHTVVIPEYLTNGPESKIVFASAEVLKDVKRKAYGPEYQDVMVDQAEQFTEEELKLLKLTCRWPGMPEESCKFGVFFNPGGPGAAFLRRVFHTHEYHEREQPEDFQFMQAYAWDNVEWCLAALRADAGHTDGKWKALSPDEQREVDTILARDFYSWTSKQRFDYFITRSQYGQELNSLDASMRPGQLLGEFMKFAGQYFSNWNESECVISGSEFRALLKARPWLPRWGSLDWGYAHHTAFGWHAQVGEVDDSGRRRPLTVTYREYVPNAAMSSGSRLSERALAEEIVARNDGDRLQNIFAGHDLWEEDSHGKTKEAAMSEVFVAAGLPSLKHAKTQRVNGWSLIRLMVDEREWLVTDECPNVIAAMPMAIHDEKHMEDVLKTLTADDDVRDMVRYGLFSQYGIADIPFEEKLKQQTAHLVEPTARNIQITKILADRKNSLRNRGMVNSRSGGRYSRY